MLPASEAAVVLGERSRRHFETARSCEPGGLPLDARSDTFPWATYGYLFWAGDQASESSTLAGFRVRFRWPLPSGFMT